MAEITTTYKIGEGLKVVGDTIEVDVTDHAEDDNKQPITSRGVAIEVGNLDALLSIV